MAEHVHRDGPIWALDWLCIIVGVLLLAAWVLSAQEATFLLGLLLFVLGCAVRSKWQTDHTKDEFDN